MKQLYILILDMEKQFRKGGRIMLKLEGNILYIFPSPDFPEQEQVDILRGEINELLDETDLRNKNIKIVGPLTRSQCIMLGSELAYICKSMEILAENENEFVKCFISDPTLRGKTITEN